MGAYVLRRMILLPLTLFCIILVNFIILNLAPGDPTSLTEISEQGASRRSDRSMAFGNDDRWLNFREYYGLTLPILYNNWPWIQQKEVDEKLQQLISKRYNPTDSSEMPHKSYEQLRTLFGDQAKFVMPLLLHVLEDKNAVKETKEMSSRFFVRGGTRQAILGAELTEEEKKYNRKVGIENNALSSLIISGNDTEEEANKKIMQLRQWYEANKSYYQFAPTEKEKISILFTQTRFWKYMSRVLTLDFGTMRNDNNKTVISEVTKRFKYSLTLSIIPMVITLFLCLFFGFIMAYYQSYWQDYSLRLVFLILYAIPIFVVAPFLIEKIGLQGKFPFTNIQIPISGFTSPERIYNNLNSYQRLLDVLMHICLPLIAILYGSLAAQSRLARTAIVEVKRQDFVTTARAKGLSRFQIMWKHVGRNAAITIVTSIAGSLGIVLGGSLIVETLFEIDGYGKFFYDAILNRDYNVIMFSAFAGSFLTLLGYLIADICYAWLDPRITLD